MWVFCILKVIGKVHKLFAFVLGSLMKIVNSYGSVSLETVVCSLLQSDTLLPAESAAAFLRDGAFTALVI